MSSSTGRRCVLGLSLVKGISPILGQVLARGEDPREIFGMTAPRLAERLGLEASAAAVAARERDAIDLDAEEERLREVGAWITYLGDIDYPQALAATPHPPSILYVKGTIPEGPAVALVGSRKASPYGTSAAHKLARELAEARVTVVSGYALGIDYAAHRAAVDAGGKTIAVLGCGIDICYPARHAAFAPQVVRSGCFISELAIGTPPLPQHFPMRNRIISGLSVATVVVEAAVNSGSLYTADFALAQGREVLAVPGSIYSPLCEGTNALLADGAGPVRSAEDIFDAVGLEAPERAEARRERLSEQEAQLLRILGAEALGIDELVGRSSLAAAEVSTTLVLLEMKAAVRRGLDQRYVATGG